MLTVLALAFMVATIVSMTLTPLSIQWAQRLGIVARPSARKVHREPVPSWGGIALTIAFLFGTSVRLAFPENCPRPNFRGSAWVVRRGLRRDS
jgi:UDP-GlcNAc:undecaprenyl-phosphate GlcNAc-1-phosphate transferase